MGNHSFNEKAIPPNKARLSRDLIALSRAASSLRGFHIRDWMQMTRRLPGVLLVLVTSLVAAHAQTATTYYFLEVIDTAGRPVPGATVESIGNTSRPLETDENGVLKDFPVSVGDFNTLGFKISKTGYLTFEQRELYEYRGYWTLLKGEIPSYEEKRIKVVLLRTPNTADERVSVEAEERRRELLLAVKRNDVATVQKLLEAGVSPNATDVYGIPVILWAAARGHPPTIKALLTAGADVRQQKGRGRKALLYYLDMLRNDNPVDVAVVRSLIEAGADINAVNAHGQKILSLAKQTNDAEVITILEGAGARP